MADMTWSEFKVDLRQLHDAIGSVSHESGLIGAYMSQIAREFAAVKDDWAAPSEMSFEDVQRWFTRVQGDLHTLLDETVERMKKAYANYHAAELANTQNLAAKVPGGSGDNGGGSGNGDSGHHDAKTAQHSQDAQQPATATLRRAMAPHQPQTLSQPSQQ